MIGTFNKDASRAVRDACVAESHKTEQRLDHEEHLRGSAQPFSEHELAKKKQK